MYVHINICICVHVCVYIYTGLYTNVYIGIYVGGDIYIYRILYFKTLQNRKVQKRRETHSCHTLLFPAEEGHGLWGCVGHVPGSLSLAALTSSMLSSCFCGSFGYSSGSWTISTALLTMSAQRKSL